MSEQIKRGPGRPRRHALGDVVKVTLELPVDLWRYISETTDNRTQWVIDALLEKSAGKEKAMPVHYVEVRELENRGAVDPAPSSEVEGWLLVSMEHALEFEANRSSYGSDTVYIFPAFHKGERCWLKRAVWNAAYGYSASGTQESILSFEEGVKLFLEHGVFEFHVPGNFVEA